MNTGRVLLSCAGLLVILFFGSSVALGQVPRDLGALVALNSEPTSEQNTRINRYVAYWLDQLGGDDPRSIDHAANKLIEPASDGLATALFRFTYSQRVLSGLREIIRTGSDFQAVQATKVIGFLRTADALVAIQDLVDPEREPRWRVRLWAAKSARLLLQHVGPSNIATQAQVDGALRRIREAGEREDNWVVLLRNFEALAAIQRSTAREQQVTLLGVTIDRMQEQPNSPSELMLAICRVLDNLLLQYADPALPQAEQRAFGVAIAPLLTRIYEVADMHFGQARDRPEMKAAYGKAIEGSDKLLALIDAALMAAAGTSNTDSRPQLRPAWDSANQQQFRSNVQAWNTRIASPPYRR